MALRLPHPWPVRLLATAVALLLAAALTASRPGLFASWDAWLSDLGWRIAASHTPEERLVLIDIDERSLTELGPWPWPRHRLAALAERLAEAGVAIQVWDLVLDAQRPDEAHLAATLRKHRAVLAAAFAFPGQGEAVEVGRLDPSATSVLPCTAPWPVAHGHRAPAPVYDGLPLGHIAPRVDQDGVVRALPAYVCRAGHAWPALPLAAWLIAAHARPTLQQGSGLTDAPWRLTSPALPEAIPLGRNGELFIPYLHRPEAYPAVSAADLLAGRVPPQRLAGRIAIVGATALGLADVVATPLLPAAGGLLVHAELLTALLDGRLPRPLARPALIQILAALTASGLLLLVAARRPAAWALPMAGLCLALGLLGLQITLQLTAGWLVALLTPALGALLAGLALGALEYGRLHAEADRLFAHLASYLPAPLAEWLRASEPQDDITAQHTQATVLVADLRNFSLWSEAHTPLEVAGLLHDFFTTAVECVETQGGVVEALEGDAVLAVWNARQPCPEHAARALAAARCLQRRMAARLPAGDPEALPPPMALELGLESGQVLAGALGPRRRRQHLTLGLPVARAVRLARMCAELGHPVLVGPGLLQHLPATQRQDLIPQGEFLLEGLAAPCTIYAMD